MQKHPATLGFSAVLLGVVLILFVSGPGRIADRSEEASPHSPTHQPDPRSVDELSPQQDEPRPTILPIAQTTSALHHEGTAPQEDFLIIQTILDQFRKHHGSNPIGDNDDIVAALLGRNSKSLAYLPPDLPALDEQRQLLDRWGTPYFFHALSGSKMDIRSAGPDRILFSSDDLLHSP